MARARIKFLTPKAKILAQVAKPRGQEILAWGVKNFILAQAIGWESYSYEFSNRLEASK